MFKATVNSFLLPFITTMTQLAFDGIPIICFMCEFNPLFYSDSLAIQILGMDLFNKLSGSVPIRKAEFLAGRALAASVLNELKIKSSKVDIGAGRAPIWPENVKGSISHADQVAICAVCPERVSKRIGIDVEPLKNEVSDDLIETIVSKAEEELANDHGLIKEIAFSLIFSAKESLFKALYPEVNRYFDFDSAAITTINSRQKTFEIVLKFDLNDSLKKGMAFTGSYLLTDTQVITVIID